MIELFIVALIFIAACSAIAVKTRSAVVRVKDNETDIPGAGR